MVLLKRICPPERRKAVIAVAASLSHPTVSINAPPDPEHPFQLRISLRIAQTTQPGRPITIRTDGTVFQPSHPSDEYDTLSRGGAGLVSTTPNKRHISLGRFISHIKGYEDYPDDLKVRPFTHLLTIPADGAVEVVHDFSISRIFRHEQRLTKDDVVGESWKAYLNDGFIGATWWRWGDLEGDLKEKHLHIWHEGCRNRLPEPDVDDTWVLGCDLRELIFENQTEDASFRFVE
ncbi:hypothetical protein BFW01_g8084 [Lasiodiplodia theobromae]|nr:hypothetical protein BFW01_g8084 [Lasiodiplodia theobromae]